MFMRRFATLMIDAILFVTVSIQISHQDSQRTPLMLAGNSLHHTNRSSDLSLGGLHKPEPLSNRTVITHTNPQSHSFSERFQLPPPYDHFYPASAPRETLYELAARDPHNFDYQRFNPYSAHYVTVKPDPKAYTVVHNSTLETKLWYICSPLYGCSARGGVEIDPDDQLRDLRGLVPSHVLDSFITIPPQWIRKEKIIPPSLFSPFTLMPSNSVPTSTQPPPYLFPFVATTPPSSFPPITAAPFNFFNPVIQTPLSHFSHQL